MRKKLLLGLKLLAIALFSTGFVNAQTGSVKGVILDQESNESVVGANIILQGTSTGTISGTDGSFELGGLPVGNQVIVISFIGYGSREIPVRIQAGSAIDLGTITLESQAIGLQ